MDCVESIMGLVLNSRASVVGTCWKAVVQASSSFFATDREFINLSALEDVSLRRSL